MKEVETGLMRLSQNEFDTENYFFQEGQYLAESTVTDWLARSSQTKDGLNPPTTDSMPAEERATKAPIYLSHIVEQNYLTKTSDNKVKLGGISIGLSLNSIYYYQKKNMESTMRNQFRRRNSLSKERKWPLKLCPA